jgi:hypothetical protein
MTTNVRRNPRLERGLALVAVVAGALAVVAGSPTRGTRGTIDVQRIAQLIDEEEDHVSAAELGRWIKDRNASLRLYEWMTTVMNPRLPESSTRAERDSVLELTQYFGGQLELVPNASPIGAATSPARPTVSDSTAAADLRASIKRAKRRAC